MKIVLAVMTLFALAAAGDPLQSQWRVTLKLLAGDDPAAVARQLAATYRGTLLSPVDEASSSFAIAISDSSAGLLRGDRRVARVEVQAGQTPAQARVATNTAAEPMLLGDYAYDGSGNITGIGTDGFVYDRMNRLESAHVADRQQDYTCDAFGNVLTITTDEDAATKKTLGVNAANNRIDISAAPNNVFGSYDGAGNMISYLGVDSFVYDGAGMVKESIVGSSHRAYLYSASDERVATLYSAGNNVVRSEWTLRDAGGAVLRRFNKQGTTWTWAEDYIYRDGALLAANTPTGTQHFHLDHLGSPRLITTGGGVEIARHTYLPFGEEAAPSNDPEPRRFTGHEKDDVNLYYMHARYYLPYAGRFLSVDPVLDIEAAVQNPQRWNRYSYVSNNPINKIDPDGREENFYMEKLFREQQMVGDGTMSEEEYWDRRRGEGIGGLTGASMVGGGLLLRGGWRAATVFAMRNPGVVLMGMKVLDSLGGNVSSRLNSTGLTGGKHGYLLDNATKSGFFRGVMGLTEKTIGGALRSHFAENFAKNSRFNGRGFLEVTGRMVDSKGRAWNVTTTWQWNQKTKVWDLITADNFRQIK